MTIKPYLKSEEAMIYCNLARTRLAMKCEEYGIYKNANGCYKREDLDLILSGAPSKLEEKARNLRVGKGDCPKTGGHSEETIFPR